ncbi:MAG: ABC transporter permease [Chloroflexota bacterium]|nr:ABC transporter permease [Chloroflexota bacterium]
MTTVQNTIARIEVAEEHRKSESLTTKALRRLRKDKLTLMAMAVILVLVALAALAPVIEGQLGVSYTQVQTESRFLPFGSFPNILGTDDLGRDHLARLLYGGRVSLSIAFFAAMLSIVIGVSLGMITGYYGGIIDDVVNWFISTLNSIPQLFLLLIISALFIRTTTDSGVFPLILVLGLLGWTGTTRLVRGETLSLREREYVVAARAMGANPLRIMFVHILPNLFSVIIITLMIDLGSLIIAEATLSFLGLGVKPPEPTWGNMLQSARDYFNRGVHLVIMPGLLIFITVLCLYVIGDGLRDAFDPTAKE